MCTLFNWQERKELNPHQWFWRPLCYHYTTLLYLIYLLYHIISILSSVSGNKKIIFEDRKIISHIYLQIYFIKFILNCQELQELNHARLFSSLWSFLNYSLFLRWSLNSLLSFTPISRVFFKRTVLVNYLWSNN